MQCNKSCKCEYIHAKIYLQTAKYKKILYILFEGFFCYILPMAYLLKDYSLLGIKSFLQEAK